jgi:glycosyltransferase involved in cell wall biosynthesis
MYKDGISVIICCYNSVTRLQKTLEYLVHQAFPENMWELIVVDNNSNDNTGETARREWEQYNVTIPIKVSYEPMPGLSYARQKGVTEACFEFVLFCDDDNWLERNYLRYTYEILTNNTNIGVLGGRSEGHFEAERPSWFKSFEHAYALGKQMPSTGIANRRRYVAGAGMVVRKEIFDILDKITFNNLLTDRKGNALSSGGDSELCLIILFLGYDLYYDERLEFIHFIPAKRLSWKYCVNMVSESHGSPQIYFDFYKILYKKMADNESLSFEEVYKVTSQKMVRAALKNFTGVKNFLRSMKLIVLPQPGSMKEIELKASFKNLTYLIVKKRQLRKEFHLMQDLMYRIKTENARQHRTYKERFFVQ